MRFGWRRVVWRLTTSITGWRWRGLLSLEHQSLSCFLGENADNGGYRHDDLMRHATKAPATSNLIVAHMQVAHRIHAKVQHNLAVLDVSRRHLRLSIHSHCQIGSKPAICAPVV